MSDCNFMMARFNLGAVRRRGRPAAIARLCVGGAVQIRVEMSYVLTCQLLSRRDFSDGNILCFLFLFF